MPKPGNDPTASGPIGNTNPDKRGRDHYKVTPPPAKKTPPPTPNKK